MRQLIFSIGLCRCIVHSSLRALSHLLEPFQSISREVVPLRMGQDILGQGREHSLKVGALGSGSHIEQLEGTSTERTRAAAQSKNTMTPPRRDRLPRLGCLLCLPGQLLRAVFILKSWISTALVRLEYGIQGLTSFSVILSVCPICTRAIRGTNV